ncbi:MAG: portal protein [Candidatus Binatia bacterium]|nr:portal protein [Candidatus Binatia bacterium]
MPMIGADDAAVAVIRRFDHAVSLRGNWESHWEEIARRVLTHYSGSFTSGGMTRTQGEKRTEDMVDATAALALPKFASVMESMNTPRNSRWQRVIPTDRALLKNRGVRLWFEDVTDILFNFRNAPLANFSGQMFEKYQSLGAFGTGVIFTDRLRDGGLRYRAIPLGEIYFLENHQGLIDTAFRRFPLTARQAKQWFGEDRLPDKVKAALKDTANPSAADKEFWFIHCVKPREDYDPDRRDVKGMLYASQYVNVEEKVMVREEGYNSFPYSISRYVQAPGELYGRSPAMLALPAIKTLNEEKRTVLKQGHRIVDPVLLAHDDGVIDTFSLRPGAVNAGGVNADGRVLVHALPTGNLALAPEMMDAERLVIHDSFLVNLFQVLLDSPVMTATQVLEMAKEKNVLLSPTMGREQNVLSQQTERELDLLAMQGLLPPMPQILLAAQGQYQIEYDSPLSRAQKAENAAGLFRAVDWMAATINITQDPSPLDWVNWDEAVPAIMDIQAVPHRWQNSLDQVQAIREGRAQARQEQQMIDAAPAMASVSKQMMPAA